MRAFAEKLDFTPVAPLKRSRKSCGIRSTTTLSDSFATCKVCARYDKLDAIFSAFIYPTIIIIALRRVNTP